MEQLLDNFSLDLFVKQSILFLILMFLLIKFAWKPILESLERREEGIKDALDSAEAARREMQNLQSDNEKLIKEARAEREAMLKEARDMKAKMIADAEGEAQEKANALIKKAQEAIETEKKSAMAELKAHVASLSLDIAEKVVKTELSAKGKHTELVETLLKDTKLN